MIDKTDRLPDLAPGDRIVWSEGPHGISGTVREVKPRIVQGANGPFVADITVVIDVAHWPTWDDWGWPRSEPRIVTRTFWHTDSTVEWAYTPDPPLPDTPGTR